MLTDVIKATVAGAVGMAAAAGFVTDRRQCPNVAAPAAAAGPTDTARMPQ